MVHLPHPLPVIVCGRSAAVGKPVAEALLPELEVVHFIQTNDAALAEIPHLLAGRDPKSPHENGVGSGNYSQPARAVIFGRGYSESEVESFRAVCKHVNRDPVLWVVGDPSKRQPGPPPPGYAKIAAQNTKDVVMKWKENGANKEEIILY